MAIHPLADIVDTAVNNYPEVSRFVMAQNFVPTKPWKAECLLRHAIASHASVSTFQVLSTMVGCFRCNRPIYAHTSGPADLHATSFRSARGSAPRSLAAANFLGIRLLVMSR